MWYSNLRRIKNSELLYVYTHFFSFPFDEDNDKNKSERGREYYGNISVTRQQKKKQTFVCETARAII